MSACRSLLELGRYEGTLRRPHRYAGPGMVQLWPCQPPVVFSCLPRGVGHASDADWPGGIRDHYGAGSQGLFKPVLPPLGALFRLRVLSISALSSRVLILLASSWAIGVLRVIPILAPLHPSEQSRLVPEPSFFFLPLRGLFFTIFFYHIPLS